VIIVVVIYEINGCIAFAANVPAFFYGYISSAASPTFHLRQALPFICGKPYLCLLLLKLVPGSSEEDIIQKSIFFFLFYFVNYKVKV
jgi:hypothetical protein